MTASWRWLTLGVFVALGLATAIGLAKSPQTMERWSAWLGRPLREGTAPTKPCSVRDPGPVVATVVPQDPRLDSTSLPENAVAPWGRIANGLADWNLFTPTSGNDPADPSRRYYPTALQGPGLIDRVEPLQPLLLGAQGEPMAAQPVPAPPVPAPPVAPPVAPPAVAAPKTAAEPLPAPKDPQVRRAEGDDKLVVNVQNTDIREVLQLLSAQGGLNILASKNVTGEVSASLSSVNVETALAAILKSTGFVARREGDIIYVGTPADMDTMDQTNDRLLTRVYRPNYVKAADLQTLIAPLLTAAIGKITVSAAAEIDIPSDKIKTGGNNFGGTDVVMVRDFESVLKVVDQVVAEIDTRPSQVAIEAMILSVRLQNGDKVGVNWDVLKNKANIRLVTGSAAATPASVTTGDGGLKIAFLDGSFGALVDALETIGETNVIAAPRLTVLNKQRAEIQIGEELGYVNTTVTENAATQQVAFLEVGTLLRLRPFIGTDGLIRLEVHPELSTGAVTVQQGLTLPNKAVTQVTTNVMCRDGYTVIIGGLIREDLKNDTKQFPWLGNVPVLGNIFKNRNETVDRSEVIVLLTPRIVGDDCLADEGTRLGNEFTQRQEVVFDKMHPGNRLQRAERFVRLAKAAYAAEDYDVAMRHVNLAIHHDPMNREAIRLRNEVVAAGCYENESVGQYLRQGLPPQRRSFVDYSKDGYSWKDGPAFTGPHPGGGSIDMGTPTPKRTLEQKPPPPRGFPKP